MAGAGHNGGPPLKLTPTEKLKRISDVLNMGISAAQKCVGIGIIVSADADGVAHEMSTERLKTIASVKDRETVYKATRVLSDQKIAEPIKAEGRPNSYRIVPSHVIEEIERAYNERKAPVGSNPTGQGNDTRRVQPDGVVWSNRTGTENATRPVEPDGVVGSNPTGPTKPDGSNPTGRGEPDGSRARTPARIETPSGLLPSSEKNLLPPPSNLDAARGGDERQDHAPVPEGFAGLNGSALDVLRFIAKHARVSEDEARSFLANNLKAFGDEIVLEAYIATTAAMTECMIATPYKYLITTARNLKDRKAQQRFAKQAAPADPSKEAQKAAYRKRFEEAQKVGK